MNIFWLDRNPRKSASYYCDAHVVKMVSEYTQLLSTAVRLSVGRPASHKGRFYRLLKGETIDRRGEILNKRGFNAISPNSPLARWVYHCESNYSRLYDLTLAVADEYTQRYGKVHASLTALLQLPQPRLPDKRGTRPPLVMPLIYQKRDLVESYRDLYRYQKVWFAKWSRSERPHWMDEQGSHRWYNGSLLVPISGFKRGSNVFFRKTDLQSSDPDLGQTYWVTDERHVVHVHERFGGPRLMRIVGRSSRQAGPPGPPGPPRSSRQLDVVLAELLRSVPYDPRARQAQSCVWEQQ